MGRDSTGESVIALSRRIADAARRGGRPVAVAMTVPASDRNQIKYHWKVSGVVLVADTSMLSIPKPLKPFITVFSIDTAGTRASAAAIESWRAGRAPHPAIDPVHEYFFSVLRCPSLVLGAAPSKAQLASLDSVCNLR